MKAFYNIGRIAFWSVLMTLCLACSDGDDSNGGGSEGQDKKRLSTVNYSYMYEDGRVENAKEEYLYDDKGRISVWKYYSWNGYGDRDDLTLNQTISFSYGDDQIVVKTNYGSGTETRTCTLNEYGNVEKVYYRDEGAGVIDDEPTTFTYDDQQQLVQITGNGTGGKYRITYTWENGNIVKIEEAGYDLTIDATVPLYTNTTTFDYTLYPSWQGIVYKYMLIDVAYSDLLNAGYLLAEFGYLGKKPQNLIACCKEMRNGKSGELTISYKFGGDGYVSKLNMSGFGDFKGGYRDKIDETYEFMRE